MLILVPALVEVNESKSRSIYLFAPIIISRYPRLFRYEMYMFTCFTRLWRKSVASFFTQRILAQPPVPKQVQAFTSSLGRILMYHRDSLATRVFSAYKTTSLILYRRNFLISFHIYQTAVSFLVTSTSMSATISIVDSNKWYPCEFSYWMSN